MAGISCVDFGTVSDGQKVRLYKVERKDISFCVTDYGCSITCLNVKNKDGSFTDVVLGMDTLAGYANSWGSFGAIVGRFANRIKGAAFELDGKKYSLTENTEGACLHGGFPAWGNIVWQAKEVEKGGASGICFSRDFADGEQGFPGNLHVEVEYLITDENELCMNYRATTDKATPLSITNHSYFNLKGSGCVHDYKLKLYSDTFVQVDENNFPTGQFENVRGTEYDFTTERPLCDKRNSSPNPGFMAYDICYVSKAKDDCGIPLEGKPLVKIAELIEPETGRKMTVSTNQEGFQLYSAKYVNHIPGKKGVWYRPYQAVCIETQSFPDSPNQKNFPTTVLQPGQVYDARTVYKFSL